MLHSFAHSWFGDSNGHTMGCVPCFSGSRWIVDVLVTDPTATRVCLGGGVSVPVWACSTAPVIAERLHKVCRMPCRVWLLRRSCRRDIGCLLPAEPGMQKEVCGSDFPFRSLNDQISSPCLLERTNFRTPTSTGQKPLYALPQRPPSALSRDSYNDFFVDSLRAVLCAAVDGQPLWPVCHGVRRSSSHRHMSFVWILILSC